MDPSPIRVIALCSQILGVFFLAKSISIKTPKYVLHELLRFKVKKSRFFRQHISQKLESIIGLVFLFLGLGLQVYLEVEGLADLEERTAGAAASAGLTNWWMVIIVTVAVMGLIAWVLSRITRFFSGKVFVELMRFMVETHGYPLQKDQDLLLELGRIMRIPRSGEDTVESYCDKVREKMKLTEPPRSGLIP